jgi:RNA polymerase sigma-70 factor (ECF subfamily)
MELPAEIYQAHRDFLWGLCYRMTGNAADADDLVQETFVRALENPPRRTAEPLRPWLVRVAMNLSRDHLRRRRRHYVGPWLPSPVPTDDAEPPASYEPHAAPEESPMARYEMLESISFAFLLALEALTPLQRAVLLLREVFDYSTKETAEALGVTETSVKVTLHRARHAMQAYNKDRAMPDRARREKTRQALERFLFCLSVRDAEGLEQLLAEDVVSISDGGGEVPAALLPIRGRDKVVRFFIKTTEKDESLPRVTFRLFNGMPALLIERDSARPGHATRFTVHCDVDAAGRIHRLHFVLAPNKLSIIL